MPRKTKKTSTVKPEGTKEFWDPPKPCNEGFAFVLGAGALAAVIAVGLLIRSCVSTPTPQYGECYQHREEDATVARIESTVYHDFGTEVYYNIETVDYYGTRTQDLNRWDDSFASIYKKMDNCEKYYRMKAERKFNETVNELVETREELLKLKAKKHP